MEREALVKVPLFFCMPLKNYKFAWILHEISTLLYYEKIA